MHAAGDRSPYSPVLVPGFAETEDGHTVIFASPGYFKAQEFVSQRPACHTMENDLMLVRAGMEWMMKRVDDRSYEKKKMLYSIKVIDAQHLGREILPIRVYEVRKFAQDNGKQLMSMYCDHDILLLIVNAPWIIRFVVMFATTFMTKRQSARLKVLGSASDADVQAQLRVVGPTSMFPPSLGGTKKPEDIPLYFPLAQDNPSRIAEWMARKEAGITRKGATNPPKPGTRHENVNDSKEVVHGSVTTPIANVEVEEEAATKVSAEVVWQAGFAAQRHEPQSAPWLVTRRDGRMLAKSIRAIAFPSSDPHLCWKNRTLGSLSGIDGCIPTETTQCPIWQSPERGELCGVGHACWHFRDLGAAKKQLRSSNG
ncbi:unnamed protein product [Symbiodinium necroappetens]|uniref:CRAL-TRIO domain-containing protein n=1 Tax=Symbiodinium necroappetens TaxID=1628268 RepID=A0A812W111_9DINO|nr:unnamed protein product [Symbiodinium necroappetens]